MLALYNDKTGEVVQYVHPGGMVRVPEKGGGFLDIHGAAAGWTAHGHRLLEVVEIGEPRHAWQEYGGETTIVDGDKLIRERLYTDMGLDIIVAEMQGRIDAQAEQARALTASPYAGQIGVYLMKQAEAQDLLSRPDGGKGGKAKDYPLVASDVGISATDMVAAANAIMLEARAWQEIAAKIETIRRKTKADLANAGTVAEAIAVFNAVHWAI